MPCVLATKKVLVLKFSETENAVFLWAKKLMERWYLLVTEKFLFWTFWWWEIRGFFSAKTFMERWYLLGLFELSIILEDLRNMVFRTVDPVENLWWSFFAFFKYASRFNCENYWTIQYHYWSCLSPKALSLMFERILNTALLNTRIFIPYTGLPFFGSKEKKIKELGKIS